MAGGLFVARTEAPVYEGHCPMFEAPHKAKCTDIIYGASRCVCVCVCVSAFVYLLVV